MAAQLWKEQQWHLSRWRLQEMRQTTVRLQPLGVDRKPSAGSQQETKADQGQVPGDRSVGDICVQGHTFIVHLLRARAAIAPSI